MSEKTLEGCRVLVVEDEYMLADDLATELGDAGATVLGPVATLEDAMAAINGEPDIDGVVLDVNLRGKMVFAAADLLLEREVPFAFTTGYDEAAIPARYAHIVRCEKPVSIKHVVKAIGRIIHN